MQSSKINIGVIGAGRMGVTHYSILNAHPDVSIVAVADTTPVINSLIEKYLHIHTYKDYARLLEKERVDALLVCTPPFLNHEILTAAHKRGLHAFVEKPYTTSYREGAQIAELYEGGRLVNQVGYVNRFNDVFLKARELLYAGVVGNVIRFRSEMYSRTVIREADESGWRSQRASGGGAIYEMASHSIDLVNFLFGAPDKVVGTCLSSVFSKSVEDVVSCSFRYRNGLVGSLYVNWSDESFRKPTNKIEIFGTRGKIIADQHGLKLFLSSADEARGLRAGWNSLYITDVFSNVPFFVRGIEFTAQLYDFIECIKAGGARRSRCTFADATATLRIIEAMLLDHARIEKELH